MDERRKFIRLAINVNVEWKKLDTQDNENKSQSISKNLSEDGVCLIIYDHVEPGDILSLDVGLPTGKVINAQGKVVWVNEFKVIGDKVQKKYDVGVEFIDMNKEDRAEIDQFVFKLINPGKNHLNTGL